MLHTADIQVVSDCGVTEADDIELANDEKMFCAGGQGGRGFCFSDEGAPLVRDGPDGTKILEGDYYYWKENKYHI